MLEGESLNEIPNGERINAVQKDINGNNGNIDLSGSQPNMVSVEDEGVNNSEPVIFEPEVLSNTGAREARIFRKTALKCRKLLQEKIKSGQLGK